MTTIADVTNEALCKYRDGLQTKLDIAAKALSTATKNRDMAFQAKVNLEREIAGLEETRDRLQVEVNNYQEQLKLVKDALAGKKDIE